MALVSIMLGSRPEGVEQIYMAAKDHLVIGKFFLIPGGMGIVFTALAYSILSSRVGHCHQNIKLAPKIKERGNEGP